MKRKQKIIFNFEFHFSFPKVISKRFWLNNFIFISISLKKINFFSKK